MTKSLEFLKAEILYTLWERGNVINYAIQSRLSGDNIHYSMTQINEAFQELSKEDFISYMQDFITIKDISDNVNKSRGSFLNTPPTSDNPLLELRVKWWEVGNEEKPENEDESADWKKWRDIRMMPWATVVWNKIVEFDFSRVKNCPVEILKTLNISQNLKDIINKTGIFENIKNDVLVEEAWQEMKIQVLIAILMQYRTKFFDIKNVAVNAFKKSKIYTKITSSNINTILLANSASAVIDFLIATNVIQDTEDFYKVLDEEAAWKNILDYDIKYVDICPTNIVKKLGYENLAKIQKATGILENKNVSSAFKELLNSAPKELQDIFWQNWKAPQNPKYHPEGNTLKHIMIVTKRAIFKYPNNINLILAAFFHDLGKFKALGWKNDIPTQHGHEDISTELVKQYSDWIITKGGDVDEVEYIVSNHMKIKPETWNVMRQSKKDKITQNTGYKNLRKFGKIDKGGMFEKLQYDDLKVLQELYPGGRVDKDGCYVISIEGFDILINKNITNSNKYDIKYHRWEDRDTEKDFQTYYIDTNISLEELIKRLENECGILPERWKLSDILKNVNNNTGVFEKNNNKDMNDITNILEEFDFGKVEFDYTDYSLLTESVDDDFDPEFDKEMSGVLVDKDKIEQFMFAGKAIFTIRNNATGNRFTFRVMRPKKIKDDVYFVSVLTGGDNEHCYTFFGTIFDKTRFKISAKTKIDKDSEKGGQSIKVFQWFWQVLLSNNDFPKQIQIWHEGVCGKCGKKLTVPESIDIGLGPICARSAELWQRSARLVQNNNKTGIFDSHVLKFDNFLNEEFDAKAKKFKQLEKDWQDIYKLNNKITAALRKVKNKETYDNIEKFEEKVTAVLSKFEISDLRFKKVEMGYEINFSIDENKFKFEFFTNGKLKDAFEGEQYVKESTEFDTLFLGQKLKEIKDVIPAFRLESSFNLNDSQIVAMDSYTTLEEAIENLRAQGYSIGKMQGDAPIGIAKGDITIEKWRNLGNDAIQLDGIIVSLDNQYFVLYFVFPEL